MGVVERSSTLVFLDFKWPGSRKGRVHIRLVPDTTLARQFVFLCSGELGHSYRNTKLFDVHLKGEPGEWICGGDYQYNSGDGGAALLPDLRGNLQEPCLAGDVWAAGRLWRDRESQFGITTRRGGSALDVFGHVESGLEVVKAAANYRHIKEVTVVDCGVVING